MITRYKRHFLYPADLYASTQPALVTTILGSCVAVCLWDERLKQGGMNHFMLPEHIDQSPPSPKYGNVAIERLIRRMQNLGSDINDLKAKVFGGAEVIVDMSSRQSIGSKNIEIAIKHLKMNDITIVSSDLGGNLGRKIIFDNFKGSVKLKYIQKSQCNL